MTLEKLTHQLLVDNDACEKMTEEFDRIFPEGLLRPTTPEQWKDVLVKLDTPELRAQIQWVHWELAESGWFPNLSGLVLSEMDLSGAWLVGVNITDTDFTGTNLTGVIFGGSLSRYMLKTTRGMDIRKLSRCGVYDECRSCPPMFPDEEGV